MMEDNEDTPMNKPWRASVFCVDENTVYKISVPFGTTLEEFLEEKKPACRWCGNNHLRPIYKKKEDIQMS